MFRLKCQNVLVFSSVAGAVTNNIVTKSNWEVHWQIGNVKIHVCWCMLDVCSHPVDIGMWNLSRNRSILPNSRNYVSHAVVTEPLVVSVRPKRHSKPMGCALMASLWQRPWQFSWPACYPCKSSPLERSCESWTECSCFSLIIWDLVFRYNFIVTLRPTNSKKSS